MAEKSIAPEARPDQGRAKLDLASLGLAFLPPLFIGFLIWQFGVDVPYRDQWDAMVPIFERMTQGTLGTADFFALHSEHRIFFPRLLAFYLGKLTHWNTRAELLMIWLLAVVCLLGFHKIYRSSNPSRRGESWTLFAASLLLFTPAGFENWLHGMLLNFLLPVACTVMSLVAAQSAPFPRNFLASAFFCAVSTFSFGSGFLCWFLTTPVLLFPEGRLRWRDRRGWWIAWALSFVGCELLYFYHYTAPNHPSIFAAFQNPLLALGYVLVFLGSPFGAGTPLNSTLIASGGALVIVFSLAIFYLWLHRRQTELLNQTIPGAMLGAFSISNAVLTMLGRVGFGLAQAQASRYIIFSVFLPISLLMILPAITRHWQQRTGSAQSKSALRIALICVVTTMALLQITTSLLTLLRWPVEYHKRLTTKALVTLVNVVDEPEYLAGYVHDNDPELKHRVNFLNRIGFLRPPLVQSSSIREISDRGRPAALEFGALQRAGILEGGIMEFIGWAVLPEKQRQADAVLLTYDDKQGDSKVFALALVELPRPEVADALKRSGYFQCGWGKRLHADKIPPGALVKAWAYDAEANRAFLMQGVATFAP